MEVLDIWDGWVLRIGSVVSMAHQIFVVDKLKYGMGYEIVMNNFMNNVVVALGPALNERIGK